MATKKVSIRHVVVGMRVPELLRDLLQGIVSYVRSTNDWQVRFVDLDDFPVLLQNTKVDGAITVISPYVDDQLGSARKIGIPLVNMIHNYHPEIPSVLADELEVGRMAAKYLVSRGYQYFAFLGFDVAWSRERYRGFSNELEKSGFPCLVSPELAHMTHHNFLDDAKSVELLRFWIKRLPKPVAMLVCSDHVATGALEHFKAWKIKVPEEIAVMGVGNLVATCELAPVPLSSVAMNFQAIGYQAARILDDLMHGGKPPGNPCLSAPIGVITRRSTDAFMFENELVRSAMRVIQDRAADGLTVKELLKQVPVTRQWLDVQLKEMVGQTASQLMRKIRLDRIRDLLVNTDLSIKQIATICGFSCAENLIRFFRDAYDSPPSVYRTKYGAHAGHPAIR